MKKFSKKAKIHKRKSIILKATAIGCLMLMACGSNNAKTTQEDIRPAPVRISKPVRGNIATMITATGTVYPVQEAYIGPKVSGRIEKLFVDEGDFVKKGQPLLRLEQTRFTITVNEARAAYREALADMKNLEFRHKRQKVLFEKGIIDKQMFEDTTTQMKLAKSKTEQAKAILERAEEDLKDTVLLSPFSGFIVERKMNEDEDFFAMANAYVFHLVDTSTVKIEVNISEAKKRYVVPGETVSVKIDAFPEDEFHGKIITVNPLVDPVSRTFLTKIEVPNPDYKLESGMFARVQIIEEKKENTLMVPIGAVVDRNGEKVVFVAKNNIAVMKDVRFGIVTHQFAEVLSGLNDDEDVIVDGLYAVRENVPLKIIQEEKSTQ